MFYISEKHAKPSKTFDFPQKIMISTGPGAGSFILVTQTSRKVSNILLDVFEEFLKILGRFDGFLCFLEAEFRGGVVGFWTEMTK